MDFSTAHSAPIVVNIDGTRYTVPRFTLRHFKAWAALRAKETLDKALEQYPEPEQRARFMLYWGDPLFDVAAIADELRAPAGVIHVLETCLADAGVPAETVNALIDGANPVALRALAGQLAGVDKAIVQLQTNSQDGGRKDDPFPGAKATSGDVPSTGDSPPPASGPVTARARKTA